ncbi:MAG TPA: hypothetical protein VKU62_00575, partial [Thermoanaerobaculia bacterium]|nr:hypothetical protein [Thermoanaerobaculia bacterium]
MTARWLPLLVAIAPVLRAQTLPPAQQITSNNAINYVWSNRTSSTSGGQIQFASAPTDDTIYLYNGSSIVPVQATIPGQTINQTVTMLGSGATSGVVVGGWRRDDGVGWVSVNGGTPQTENLNPEHLSINGGCVFMTLQTGDNTLGNQAYQVNPADGTRTRIGTDGASANHGAFRVYNIGCSKLGIGWLDDNNLNDIKYWNGSALTTVDTNTTEYDFSFASGRMVYVKVVNGVQQVFLVDTNVSLTPVQLTSETDNTVTLKRPQTDGRHVAWYRVDGGGNAQIVLNGGVVFPTGPLGAIDVNAWPFQLNRGQLLWTNASTAPRTFFYDDGTRTYPIDPSPATGISATVNGSPWLTDGTIAFLGPTATSGGNNQVFRITGTTPADSSQPSPPMIATATPGSGTFGPQVTLNWDRVLGAISYNVYYAPAPGVTKANYATLGGYRTSASPGSAFPVDPGTWSFCVTTIDAGGEGPCSRTATATVIGHMTWHSVGGLGTTTFYSTAADPSNASRAYAGADGSVYKSTDGGINWTSSLAHATTAGTRTAALAVGSSGVFANIMSQATIWRSIDNGGSWSEVLSNATGFGESNGSVAIDPITPATIYAGDFKLPGYDFTTDSLIIKSTDGGSNWNFTAQGQNGASDDLHAYALAIDPVTPAKIFAGGTGTPPLAKSTNGATSWTDLSLPDTNNGGVYSIAIDPSNTNVVYVTTRDLGVYKSIDGGVTWTAANSGLSGAST